jgi:hypothetical protein
MRKTARILFGFTFCLLLVCGAGCMRNRTRTRLSGTVLMNGGQPVKVGRITLTPAGGGKTYSDSITNGRYSVRSRYSLPGGEYTVTIQYCGSPQGNTGFDRTHTDRISLMGFGKDTIDFRVR